jgi:hypothetical protein
LICPKVLTIQNKLLKRKFIEETLKDILNLKDNSKLIEPLSGHQVVKTLILISPKVLKQNTHYFKNLCIETLNGTLNFSIILNTM